MDKKRLCKNTLFHTVPTRNLSLNVTHLNSLERVEGTVCVFNDWCSDAI